MRLIGGCLVGNIPLIQNGQIQIMKQIISVSAHFDKKLNRLFFAFRELILSVRPF